MYHLINFQDDKYAITIKNIVSDISQSVQAVRYQRTVYAMTSFCVWLMT